MILDRHVPVVKWLINFVTRNCAFPRQDTVTFNDIVLIIIQMSDKNSRSCNLNCQNCGTYFDPKNSCLCDCPDGTDDSICRGL